MLWRVFHDCKRLLDIERGNISEGQSVDVVAKVLMRNPGGISLRSDNM